MKIFIEKFIILLLLLSASKIGVCSPEVEENHLSIINLIATPEKYHGKIVSIIGYAEIELENMSLCIMRKTSSSRDCVWIELYEPEVNIELFEKREEQFRKFHKKIISLRGEFDMENTGHLGASSGAIKSITEAYIIE